MKQSQWHTHHAIVIEHLTCSTSIYPFGELDICLKVIGIQPEIRECGFKIYYLKNPQL